MNDFQKYLKRNYPNCNNNDAGTVVLLVRAAQEFATIQKIEELRSLRKELEQNDDYFDERMISSRVEKLEDTLR